ncbi:MAG: efflux RND transporter permease subunit, partial [Lachnospiraceae bacterium]
MERFSVRKPFTVLVAVIAVLVIGYVSLASMTMDLLPEISLPYLIVLTTYPGASPERVETEVSAVMERSLGTVSHVKNVNTVSAENYSMAQLEFEEDTDMDSVMVKVQGALDQVRSSLPDACGTPSVVELSMDMIATMYIAVEREGMDIYELSDYIKDQFIPVIERQEGVASVNGVGLVERTVQVDLDADKIKALNEKILKTTTNALKDAEKQLSEAEAKVSEGQTLLEEQVKSFGSLLSSALFAGLQGPANAVAAGIRQGAADLAARVTTLQQTVNGYYQSLRATFQAAAEDARKAYESASDRFSEMRQAYNVALVAEEKARDAIRVAGEDATPEMTRAYQKAQEAVRLAFADLESAKDAYNAAATALAAATEKATSAVGDANLGAEFAEVIKSLQQVAANADGSTVSNLMSAVTKIGGAVSQVSTILSVVRSSPAAQAAANPAASVQGVVGTLNSYLDQVPGLLNSMESALAQMTQGQLDAAVGFSSAAQQLTAAQTQLAQARAEYEKSKEEALKNANADKLLSVTTLSQMIYAQNFSMPAGYIDDANDQSWLLKIGDAYETSEDIADVLLVDMDGIGTVRLEDVANVTVIDNSQDSYAKLNGRDSVVLSIYKGSASGTNAVSRAVKAALEKLQADDPKLTVVSLMDQGQYIDVIVDSIVRSMLLGALLAVIILALFLRDVRPTILVAISIPLSVFAALVLIYFSGLSLNMMTLSGLALGIGMLVDNSIVVIENIFRLRGRGLTAPRAAVQGAKQVFGSIAASTLTTVCVFLPMVFTTGMVRELMVPMALSISYCLLASLVVAMTVVPAASSTVLRRFKPKKSGFYENMQNAYGRSLAFCLKHKLMTLAVAIGLLVFCAWRLLAMGVTVLPDMGGNSLQATISTPEEDERAESYSKVDEAISTILSVDGVKHVGALGGNAGAASFLSGSLSAASSYGTYTCYIEPESTDPDDMKVVRGALEEAVKDLSCTVTVSSGGMSDMSALMASGLSINIYGSDLSVMREVSEELAGIVREVEGFENVSTGNEDAAKTLHLDIDKDKAMRLGLTVAQIYAGIAQRLTTSATSTTIEKDGESLAVVIRDLNNLLTRENILDMEFTSTNLASMGSAASSGSSGASGLAGMLGGGSMDASAMAGMLGGSGDASGLAGMLGGSGDSSGLAGMLGGSSDSAENGGSAAASGLSGITGGSADAASLGGSANTDGSEDS